VLGHVVADPLEQRLDIARGRQRVARATSRSFRIAATLPCGEGRKKAWKSLNR
jgi:hypothetical protein